MYHSIIILRRISCRKKTVIIANAQMKSVFAAEIAKPAKHTTNELEQKQDVKELPPLQIRGRTSNKTLSGFFTGLVPWF